MYILVFKSPLFCQRLPFIVSLLIGVACDEMDVNLF